mgnify:CR=1 FL=1
MPPFFSVDEVTGKIVRLDCDARGENQYCDLIPKLMEQYLSINKKIDTFVHEAEPLHEFVRSEIERKKRFSLMWERIGENLAGWAIIGFVTAVGYWAIEKLKQDLHISK